jgi:glycerol-1-phosphate dehydrogenase [NAD(P)+]
MNNKLALILQKYFGWKNGSTSKTLPIKYLFVEHGASDKAYNVIRKEYPSQPCLVVCDTNTYDALGASVWSALQPMARLFMFDESPKASLENAEQIAAAARNCAFIIAVGSGTINDLCKYAAFQCEKPFITFATGLSMNGYLSPTASLYIDGIKQSVSTKLPIIAVFDLEILTNSPEKLIKAGLGDTLCRITVQRDWLLSHKLLGTPYNRELFEVLWEFEQDIIKSENYIEPLCNSLIFAGLGMLMDNSSNPASQGEHMIAHALEFIFPELSEKYYHGEIIGVTAVYMDKLQRRIASKLPQSITNQSEESPMVQLKRFFPHDISEKYHEIYKNKSQMQQYDINKIEKAVKEVVDEASSQNNLLDILQKYDCLTTPNQLGLQDSKFDEIAKIAKFTRDRFTFLDVAYEE